MTTTDFDPTTNRIPFGLLSEDEQTALIHWPNGWEAYKGCEWVSIASSNWGESVVYRGKPKPVVTSVWHNIYPKKLWSTTDIGQGVNYYSSRSDADLRAIPHRIAVLRIDTCNGVSTAHLEGV
jgi:hypothetical protein